VSQLLARSLLPAAATKVSASGSAGSDSGSDEPTGGGTDTLVRGDEAPAAPTETFAEEATSVEVDEPAVDTSEPVVADADAETASSEPTSAETGDAAAAASAENSQQSDGGPQGGENVVTPDVGVEAPKPVGDTPADTALADYPQLGQSGGIDEVSKTDDPGSSGATDTTPDLQGTPAPSSDQAPERTPEGRGPTDAPTPDHSTGTPSTAPGGDSEGSGKPKPVEPKPE